MSNKFTNFRIKSKMLFNAVNFKLIQIIFKKIENQERFTNNYRFIFTYRYNPDSVILCSYVNLYTKKIYKSKQGRKQTNIPKRHRVIKSV